MRETTATERRRVLLDLCHIAADRQSIAAGAELARLLGLDLLGVFVEDEGVIGLAGMPFARELRLPAHEWSPMAAERTAGELDEVAGRVRRMLDEQGARLGVPARFELVRGDPASCVAERSHESDIVVLSDPGSAAGRAVGSFPRAWRAALRSASSVLLLPARIARHSGPVAAVVGAAPDGGLGLAARIAAAAHERLILLTTPATTGGGAAEAAARASARAAGLTEDQVATRALRGTTAEAILGALEGQRERLLVLGRDPAEATTQSAPPRLASARRVPVLVG